MKKLITAAFSLLALSLFLLSCGTPADEKSAASDKDFTIIPGKKVGLITPETSSKESVLKLFAGNARIDSVYVGQGTYNEGVVLFPDEPDKKVELFWNSTPEAGNILLFKIMNPYNPDQGTVWKTDSGITLGTSMEEVEKMNGVPFIFWGFDWDYGGIVDDWGTGKFPERLKFRFKPTELAEDMSEFSGQVQLRSNAQKVRDLKAKVDVILVYLQIPG